MVLGDGRNSRSMDSGAISNDAGRSILDTAAFGKSQVSECVKASYILLLLKRVCFLLSDPSTLQKISAPPPRPTIPQFAAQPVPPPAAPRNPFDMLECQRTTLFEHLQQINPTRKSVRKVLHYCISNGLVYVYNDFRNRCVR